MLLSLLVGFVAHCFAQQPELGIEPLIAGGLETQIKDAPWAVLYGDYCGGSILSDRWILTAAHCKEQPYIAIKSETIRHGLNMEIERRIFHPNWDNDTKDYDFQMVKLVKRMEFDETGKPVPLGDENLIKAGNEIKVAGWGQIGQDGPVTGKLQSVSIPIIDHAICKNIFAGARDVTERMFCAGTEEGGKDSCRGDSGGPATVDGKLVGVVSWGAGCAKPGLPGVYGSVPSVKQWILETMDKE